MDINEYATQEARVESYKSLQIKVEQMKRNAINIHQGVLEITASYQQKLDISYCKAELAELLEKYFEEKKCHYEKLQSEI